MKVKVKSLSCVRLFATRGLCSPPSSSVHGILQAGILEWVGHKHTHHLSQYPPTLFIVIIFFCNKNTICKINHLSKF